jgi:hemophore-related protein
MRMSRTSVRRILAGAFATCALGGVAATTIAMPAASAAPPCSASAFATTASGVLSKAGVFLDAHPQANDVLTNAGTQGAGGQASVRDYFVSHPGELSELRGIAEPLIAMRRDCNTSVSPMEIAALFEALSNA